MKKSRVKKYDVTITVDVKFYEIDRTCVALESSSCCSRRNRLSRSIESIAAEFLRYSRAFVLASELGRVV